MALHLPLTVLLLAAADGPNLQPTRTWFGILREDEKRRLAPPERFLTDAPSFAKLWRAWKPDDKIPEIDFGKNFVLVETDDKMRIDRFLLRLDHAGNLTVRLGPANSKSDPMFTSFGIALVPRTGIRGVHGRPLEK